MFDILAYLFDRYIDAEALPDTATLSRRLTAAGFEEDEIEQALGWLDEFGAVPADRYADLPEDLPTRQLHPLEAARLSDDAAEYVNYLLLSSGVSPAQRELIMDQLMARPSGIIDLETAKLATLMVLWRQGDELSNMLMEEILYQDEFNNLH